MIRVRNLSLCHVAIPLLLLSCCKYQLGAQALPTATGPGSYIAVGAGASTFPSIYDQRKISGALVYADAQPTWRVGLEGEARFLRYHTNEGVDQTNYLTGVRVAFRPQRVRPYAKFLVGATKFSAPFGYARGTYFTYVPGGGLDYLLTDRITMRAIDVEYQILPQFLGTNVTNLGLSVGLSFRLNGLSRFPRGKQCRR